MKEVILGKQGKKKGKYIALVDDDDFDRVNRFRWHIHSHGYAVRKEQPSKTQVYMHRFIMSPPDGMDIDHKNLNKLDNQKSNLRICTNEQNVRNRKAPRNNTSGYKGVSWVSRRNKWAAYVKEKQIGYFASKEEAARAYDKKAKELFGEFAQLNFT